MLYFKRNSKLSHLNVYRQPYSYLNINFKQNIIYNKKDFN